MKIHIGVTIHEFGATFFTASTEDDVKKQVADWCRANWKSSWNDEAGKTADDQSVIESYFSSEKMGDFEEAYFGADEPA